MSDWPGGPERRRRNPELDEVLAQVTALEGSVARLAGSVTKIVPDQIQVGVAEIRRLFLQIVAALATLAVVLMTYSVVALNHLNGRIDRGHEFIVCVEKLPIESRTDQAILTCRQATK